jgi:hypothetical protein
MESSNTILVLTLSHRLQQEMKLLTDENDDWAVIPRCLLEWSAQQKVAGNEVKVEEIFQDLHNRFVTEYEEELKKVHPDHNLQKAEWKGKELWLYFANQHGKNFPDWTKVNGIKIPDTKDKTIEGVVLFHPKDSSVYYSEVSRMPRHAVVQAEEFLRMGIHSSKALQRAFENTPIKRLASRFLLSLNPEFNWAISKGFASWWKDTRQGFPSVVEERTDDYGQERQTKPQWRDRVKEARQKSKSNPDFKRRVKAGKNEYQNAYKCSVGENIQAREVYARCYSKRPEWEDWSFI